MYVCTYRSAVEMKCLILLFMVVATCYCVTLTDVLLAEWTEYKVNINELCMQDIQGFIPS